jgi:CRISPR/Cas system-associated endonuclease Cas1
MTRLQRHYHIVTLDALKKRIKVWKAFEENKISLENARRQNQKIEDEIDDLMQQKLDQLESAQK